jgi:hypothetical protein
MVIQSVVHNIPTLSSPYLYSEDDIFFGSSMDADVLFKDKPMIYVSQSVDINGRDIYTKSVVQSMELAESIGIDMSSMKDGDKLLYNSHVSMMMYVEEMQKIWRTFPKVMGKMRNHAFRDSHDPHLPSLYTFMQLQGGKSKLVKEKRMAFFYFTDRNYNQTFELIRKFKNTPILCVNDDFSADPSQSVLEAIDTLYQEIFPLKSTYEYDN